MKQTNFLTLTSLLAVLLLSGFTATPPYTDALSESIEGIASSTSTFSENDQGQGKGQKGKKNKSKDAKGRYHPFSELKVPKGHLPPPGKCKIWLPNTPPGHQPAPQSCTSALRDVPLGAWVINHEGDHYRVNIFNRRRRNVIDEVRFYELL